MDERDGTTSVGAWTGEGLLAEARSGGATDVVVTWGNGAPGRFTMRSHGTTLQAASLPQAKVVARQIMILGDIDPFVTVRQSGLVARQGSFSSEAAGGRVRLTAMLGPSQGSVAMRFHRTGVIEALEQVQGCPLALRRPMLEAVAGLVAVAGRPASGKTLWMHHMLRWIGDRPAVLAADVLEIPTPPHVLFHQTHPDRLDDEQLVAGLSRLGTEVVALDEGHPRGQLRAALRLADTHLVMVTLKAPDLGRAVQMIRMAIIDQHAPMPGRGRLSRADERGRVVSVDDRYHTVLLGILRPSGTWDREGPDPVAVARWYPMMPGQAGRCPFCASPRVQADACPACGAREECNTFETLATDLLGSSRSSDVEAVCDRLERNGTGALVTMPLIPVDRASPASGRETRG